MKTNKNKEVLKELFSIIESEKKVFISRKIFTNLLGFLSKIKSLRVNTLKQVTQAYGHHVYKFSKEEKCRLCGEQASHKVEEVLDYGELKTLEDAVNAGVKHPLTVYLCCSCFANLTGNFLNWCGTFRNKKKEKI